MASSVDPDETPCSAASHLGLHCLLRPGCPNTYSIYGTLCKIFANFTRETVFSLLLCLSLPHYSAILYFLVIGCNAPIPDFFKLHVMITGNALLAKIS